MGKIKKGGSKNMFCSTCKTWMTEYYVQRHLTSKSHFSNKYFEQTDMKSMGKKKKRTQKKKKRVQ